MKLQESKQSASEKKQQNGVFARLAASAIRSLICVQVKSTASSDKEKAIALIQTSLGEEIPADRASEIYDKMLRKLKISDLNVSFRLTEAFTRITGDCYTNIFHQNVHSTYVNLRLLIHMREHILRHLYRESAGGQLNLQPGLNMEYTEDQVHSKLTFYDDIEKMFLHRTNFNSISKHGQMRILKFAELNKIIVDYI